MACVLFYKILRVIGQEDIQGRSSLRDHPGFKLVKVQDIFLQFLGELPDLDPHRTGPLTGPAVGTAAGAMEGPQKMKGPYIRGIQTLAHPLRLGFIDKTGRTITQGTGIPAGITADAGPDQFFKIFPAGLRVHGLHGPDVFITVHPGLLGHQFPDQFIVDDRIAMDTDGTIVLKKIGLLERFL